MTTELLGITKRAEREGRYRFQNLFGLLNKDLLLNNFRKIKKGKAAGIDGVTAEQYEAALEVNVEDLVSRLKEGRYRPERIRRCYIPKGEGELRPLGILTTEDKLLQLSAAEILEAIYEQDFLPVSFGYRPGVGAHDALDCIKVKLQKGRYKYIVEADVKGYFNNINHDWLMKMLKQRIDDKPFLRLLKKWLKAGVLETDGSVEYPETGTQQGGGISPVLANIYLHYVLDLWFERVVKKSCRGEARLVRYADDWICAFEYPEDAERFFAAMEKRLGKFGLELSAEKTRIISFNRFKRRQGSFEFLGMEFRWGKDSKGQAHVDRRTSPKRLRRTVKAMTEWCRSNRHAKLSIFFTKLKQKLRGYYNYYAIIGNSKSVGRFHFLIMQLVYKWLNRRSERRSYNWLGFKELLKHFNISNPKIMHRPVKMYA